MKKIPEHCLLNSLLVDGGELGLGALLVRTATALLSCGGTSTLLLEVDNSDALSLDGSLAFALSLEKLEVGDAAGRRGHGTRRRATSAGDALSIIVEGIGEEEVVVGEIRSRSLLTVGLRKRMLRDAMSMGAEDAHMELMELYEPNIVAVVVMIGEVNVVI
ncbi:hypothetical protein HG531_010988 [Fusarium graminearum]|nr:hypothetical protein HG531_010988 [Fusarium graminearum]